MHSHHCSVVSNRVAEGAASHVMLCIESLRNGCL